MKKIIFVVLFLLIILIITYVYFHYQNNEKVIDSRDIQISELPYFSKDEQIIKHKYYTLSYNEEYEQANWVAYILTNNNLVKNVKRTNKFIEDRKVNTGSASSSDYKKSGYDRGHLLPAADMTFDITAMSETFYYSNMSPQKPGFNRGIWKKLESKVRRLVQEYDTVWVVTGPVFTSSMVFIGDNHLAVPNYYYKTLLVRKNNNIEGVGFVLENKKSKIPLIEYVVTIDSVESLTGLDFYYILPNNLEDKIESEINLEYWR